jgi:LPXTG-motif cell wall-anchored protein
MDYQLPLQGTSAPIASNTGSFVPLVALLGLSLVSVSLFFLIRRRSASKSPIPVHQNIDSRSPIIEPQSKSGEVPGRSNNTHDVNQTPAESQQSESADCFVDVDELPEETKPGSSILDYNSVDLRDDVEEHSDRSFEFNGDQHNDDEGVASRDMPVRASLESASIEITSEMAAVMETLTTRERAVLSTLIEHNGKMNQADIRYETSIPKSSLTGILLSLERRKLIIKKEKGRTNSIELSGWFLSKRESSEQEK